MEYAENWNYIVSRYNELYNLRENSVQREWEDYFVEIFGYSRIHGEIDSQRSIQIGSRERGIPDIIIKANKKDLFDVELKQYNLLFSEEIENQLISYLKLLSISVGILICQNIYVYVYDHVNDKVKKAEIPFIKDNPNGIKFVELFQKENFSKELVEAFIDSKFNFEDNVSKIKEELTPENILELVKLYFEDMYLTEEIEAALRDISIEIKGKSKEEDDGGDIGDPGGGGGMDYSRYCFEGRTYGKCRLVLAVVKAYVRDNPFITYSELKEIFYDKLQGSTGVISTPSDAKARRQDPEKRFFTREPILLNNCHLWVCTQWGRENIGNFIDRAISLGYKINKV